MSLLQTIKTSQLTARKARDQVTASLLTTLIGEASMPGKNDGNRESTDQEVVAVIKKFKKNAQETLTSLSKAGNSEERISALNAEITVLDALLPKQLSNEELNAIIAKYIDELSDKTAKSAFGSVMKRLKDEHEGLFDGGAVSKLIKDALQ